MPMKQCMKQWIDLGNWGLFLGMSALTVTGSSAIASIKGTDFSTTVVGGRSVKDFEDAPFVVSLDEGSCGASVIDAEWLLTAAHCGPTVYSAQGGTLMLKAGGTSMALDIDRSISHPEAKRGQSGLTSDFMLIHLSQPIDFTKTKIRPIQLVSEEDVANGIERDGKYARVAGWGVTRESSSYNSAKLRYVDVPLVNRSVAEEDPEYQGALDDSTLAAGFPYGRKDSCQGDSGGPLYVRNRYTNQSTLIGVVSWGIGCARPGQYGIYSKVSYALPWIRSTMKDFRNHSDSAPR